MPERNERLSVEALLAKYQGRTAIVAVVGLGYVGLPLVRALIAARFRVIGLDSTRERSNLLSMVNLILVICLHRFSRVPSKMAALIQQLIFEICAKRMQL